MHPSLLVVALLTLLAAAGCGEDPEHVSSVDTRSVLYVASQREGPRGHDTEGAVEEIRLTDADGDEVAPEGGRDEQSPVWVDLPAGDYTLSAAVLPCDGSCGVLDPPTDSCELPLVMAGRGPTHLTVTFHDGQACTITADNLQ